MWLTAIGTYEHGFDKELGVQPVQAIGCTGLRILANIKHQNNPTLRTQPPYNQLLLAIAQGRAYQSDHVLKASLKEPKHRSK